MIFEGIEYIINNKLSFKDFTGWEFLSRPEYDFNNKIIYGSVFSQENPDTNVFGDIQGATFIKCNLSNVAVPGGNTIIQCVDIRFKLQNDRACWLIDKEGNPIEPTNKKEFIQLGISTNPKDIPSEPLDDYIITQKSKELGL